MIGLKIQLRNRFVVKEDRFCNRISTNTVFPDKCYHVVLSRTECHIQYVLGNSCRRIGIRTEIPAEFRIWRPVDNLSVEIQRIINETSGINKGEINVERIFKNQINVSGIRTRPSRIGNQHHVISSRLRKCISRFESRAVICRNSGNTEIPVITACSETLIVEGKSQTLAVRNESRSIFLFCYNSRKLYVTVYHPEQEVAGNRADDYPVSPFIHTDSDYIQA
ncbi:hypothetical protein D3C85_1271640 [compost metagenome]